MTCSTSGDITTPFALSKPTYMSNEPRRTIACLDLTVQPKGNGLWDEQRGTLAPCTLAPAAIKRLGVPNLMTG